MNRWIFPTRGLPIADYGIFRVICRGLRRTVRRPWGVALRYLAVSLIGFSLTGSTVAAGWLGSLAAIAQQATAIFGGTFADRHDRRILIIVNAVVGVVCWGSVAVLLMANRIVFPVLLVIVVSESAVNGFLGPASDAMLKSIVDVRSYPKARSLNEGL